jgi:uptake hydrogenase small subunit
MTGRSGTATTSGDPVPTRSRDGARDHSTITGGQRQAAVASLRSMGRQRTILWMECGACSGESMAILGAEGRGKPGHTLPAFLEDHGAHLLWHPSLSLESPRQAAAIIDRVIAGEQPLTLLCVEGSIIHGPNGTGRFDVFEGRPKRDIVAALCGRAQ